MVRARETVMDPEMEEAMTDTEAASEVRVVLVVVIVIVTQLLFCPGLVCGSNNCKQFGHYYHEKDDCCEKATSSIKKSPEFDRNEKQG